MNIIGYCRVSTDKQAAEGLSLSMQEYRIKDYAERKYRGKVYHLEIISDDGYSGRTLSRPVIQKIIAKIASNEIDMIITYDLARLTRNLMDTVFFRINKRPSRNIEVSL